MGSVTPPMGEDKSKWGTAPSPVKNEIIEPPAEFNFAMPVAAAVKGRKSNESNQTAHTNNQEEFFMSSDGNKFLLKRRKNGLSLIFRVVCLLTVRLCLGCIFSFV